MSHFNLPLMSPEELRRLLNTPIATSLSPSDKFFTGLRASMPIEGKELSKREYNRVKTIEEELSDFLFEPEEVTSKRALLRKRVDEHLEDNPNIKDAWI